MRLALRGTVLSFELRPCPRANTFRVTMNRVRVATMLVVWLCLLPAVSAAQPVVNSRPPLINQYHGTKVTDEYGWLENGADPAVRAWSAEQNKRARAYLDGLPMRAEIEDRLTRLLTNSGTDYFGL